MLAVLACVTSLSAQATSADVIVVGAGIAGLTTALESARNGATVAVVDLASVFGGHAVVSEGGLALIGTPLQAKLGARDSPDLAYDDFVRWGKDANNKAWVRTYVDRSRSDIYEWLTALGVKFDNLSLLPGNSVARFHSNPRRGFGIVEPIYRACLATGLVQFHWNTRIAKLLLKESRVAGVEGVNERTGARFHISAKSVVIATGGFQSNLPLVKANWPAELPMPAKILIGSGINAHGSGLDLARAAGGLVERLDHQWNYPRGLPDPRYPGMDRGLNFVNKLAIWVNRDGKRFMNEDAGATELLKNTLRQPSGSAWIVFDSVARKTLLVAGVDWADPKRVDEQILGNPSIVHKANSLADLAQKAGWPVQSFQAAIARFNQSLAAGTDVEFDRFNPARPPTEKVGRPAIPPVAIPPFYAARVYPMTRKSMGGIAVDQHSRVLNEARQPIAGLYAAGEVTGFNGLNGKAGLEGTFIAPSILQGRLLGQFLSAQEGWRPGSRPQRKDPTPSKLTAAVPRQSADCQSCHPVARLVASARKGYWHFERVHKVVLTRQWQCSACHAEMSPFIPSKHRIEAVAQIDSCVRCHLGTE
jgi:flavocytochrome c